MSYSPNTPVVSTLNAASSQTVAGSGTLTLDWELAPRGEVLVMCNASGGGTLFFEFSNDGTGSPDSTFPVGGFTVAAGVPEVHRAVVGGRYFRVEFTDTSGANNVVSIHTSYAVMGLLSAPIGNTIASDADASIVKAVISGVGNTNATVTDHKALQVTQPPEGKTAFGEQLVGQLTPVIELAYPYNLNAAIVTERNNGSGSASVVTSMAQLSTGAATNSSSCLISNNNIKYTPGLGIRARFTAMFTTGVADNTQIIGIGDSGEGYFVGYNGTSFGVMRRYGGNPEVRTLTVTTGSSTAENITITLDGDADATVAVTNTGDTTLTANEIAAHTGWGALGRGWTAKAVGSKVIFTSWDSATHTGTYSLSSATTAVGTFAQTLAGVAPTDSWIAQSSWSGEDIFDGTGLTGVTLDPTKLNVYQIDFQYLGAGLIRFYIEDPDDGELHLVHAIEYANTYTRPSIDNPSLLFYACTENGSTANTDITLSTASAGVFVDGIRTNNGVKKGLQASLTLGATSAETPIVSFRVKEVYQSKINRTQIKLNFISASVEHTKPCAINFYGNATLTGASFGDLDATSSVEYDTTATAFTGGTLLFTLYLGKTGNALIDMKDDLTIAEFGVGQLLTATLAPTSGNGAEGNIGFNFTERL